MARIDLEVGALLGYNVRLNEDGSFYDLYLRERMVEPNIARGECEYEIALILGLSFVYGPKRTLWSEDADLALELAERLGIPLELYYVNDPPQWKATFPLDSQGPATGELRMVIMQAIHRWLRKKESVDD